MEMAAITASPQTPADRFSRTAAIPSTYYRKSEGLPLRSISLYLSEDGKKLRGVIPVFPFTILPTVKSRTQLAI
jgi:hypothetical protein